MPFRRLERLSTLLKRHPDKVEIWGRLDPNALMSEGELIARHEYFKKLDDRPSSGSPEPIKLAQNTLAQSATDQGGSVNVRSTFLAGDQPAAETQRARRSDSNREPQRAADQAGSTGRVISTFLAGDQAPVKARGIDSSAPGGRSPKNPTDLEGAKYISTFLAGDMPLTKTQGTISLAQNTKTEKAETPSAAPKKTAADNDALFSRALYFTGRNEGLYANRSVDRGGETWAGVARNYHPQWTGWALMDEMKQMHFDQLQKEGKTGEAKTVEEYFKDNPEATKAVNSHFKADPKIQKEVDAFYKKEFWSIVEDLEVPDNIKIKLYDTAVKEGRGGMTTIIQKALNEMKVTAPPFGDKDFGKFGSKTKETLAKAVKTEEGAKLFLDTFINQFKERIIQRVKDNPELEVYKAGWLKRAVREVNLPQSNASAKVPN